MKPKKIALPKSSRMRSRVQSFLLPLSDQPELKYDADKREIYLYDSIGEWGITAGHFVDVFDAIGGDDPITLKINSGGGEVFEGLSIYNLLIDRGNVDVQVTGLAASIASVIAMAGRSVGIYDTAMMMLHKPWGVVIGNEDDMEETRALLHKITGSLVKAYVGKTGTDQAEVEKMIAGETWLTSDESLKAGFADKVINAKKEEQPEPLDLAKSGFNKIPKNYLKLYEEHSRKRRVNKVHLELQQRVAALKGK